MKIESENPILSNSEIFKRVMSQENICRLFLEALMQKRIDRIEFIPDDFEGRIRECVHMYVYFAGDESKNVFELTAAQPDDQVKYLPRIMHGAIVKREANQGVSPDDIPDGYAVIVSNEECIKAKLSVSRCCKAGDQLIPFETGEYSYILHTRFKEGNASPELLEFLECMGGTKPVEECGSELAKAVSAAVKEIEER